MDVPILLPSAISMCQLPGASYPESGRYRLLQENSATGIQGSSWPVANLGSRRRPFTWKRDQCTCESESPKAWPLSHKRDSSTMGSMANRQEKVWGDGKCQGLDARHRGYWGIEIKKGCNEERDAGKKINWRQRLHYIMIVGIEWVSYFVTSVPLSHDKISCRLLLTGRYRNVWIQACRGNHWVIYSE